MSVSTPLPQMSAAQYRIPKNEAELQRQIVRTAKTLGWRVTHHPYSIGADPGYPDLTCLKPGLPPVWIECKGPQAKVRPEQIDYLALVNTTTDGIGIMAFPVDLDAVCQMLAGGEVEFYQDKRHGGVLRVRLIE